MFLNAKGWLWLALIILIGGFSLSTLSHSNEVVYQKGHQNVDTTANPAPTPVIPQVIIADAVVNVRVATTTAAITHGLSGTPSMAENEGMIFLFPVADRYNFWMPDMHFGLDIIWIDSHKKVISISKNVPPLLDTSKPVFYKPKSPAMYVLEVNEGWSDRHSIHEGQDVMFRAI